MNKRLISMSALCFVAPIPDASSRKRSIKCVNLHLLLHLDKGTQIMRFKFAHAAIFAKMLGKVTSIREATLLCRSGVQKTGTCSGYSWCTEKTLLQDREREERSDMIGYFFR